jgi:hypothetical protein
MGGELITQAGNTAAALQTARARIKVRMRSRMRVGSDIAIGVQRPASSFLRNSAKATKLASPRSIHCDFVENRTVAGPSKFVQ